MSVAEMKLAAINEITKLNSEAAVKEILEHLAKMSFTKENKTFNLSVSASSFANTISSEMGVEPKMERDILQSIANQLCVLAFSLHPIKKRVPRIKKKYRKILKSKITIPF